jgi:hypothetical protein
MAYLVWEMFHNTDSQARLQLSLLTPSAEGLDMFRAALGAALGENSLIGCVANNSPLHAARGRGTHRPRAHARSREKRAG